MTRRGFRAMIADERRHAGALLYAAGESAAAETVASAERVGEVAAMTGRLLGRWRAACERVERYEGALAWFEAEAARLRERGA